MVTALAKDSPMVRAKGWGWGLVTAMATGSGLGSVTGWETGWG